MYRAFGSLRQVFISVLLIAAPASASAQSRLPIPRSRVVQAVDDARLTTLSGNVHPLARAEFDQGLLDEATPLHRIVLVLQRSSEQETVLRQLIDQQQDKSSSIYHQWLTPESFGAGFGPSDRDLSAVTTWLASHGFADLQVNAGHTLIEFSGTAGTVRNAFHTAMHRYNVQGRQHFANAADPSIPSALVPVVAGIASLNDFPRKAANHRLGNFRHDPATNGTTPLPDELAKIQTASPLPSFTISSGGSFSYPVTPYDFATVYNVLPLWSATTPIDGTGQTIAIVGQTDINPADFVNFRKLFDLPLGNTATPTGTQYLNIIYNGPNPGVTGDEGEADIDTQWSGAVAKGATIDYVVSESTEVTQGTDLSAIYIVDNNLASVMSYSYGQCELFLGTAGNAFYNTLWQQAAAQGITVLISSGDSGSAGCDESGVVGASGGLAVNGIGSTPWNIAVGGTDFYMPDGGTAYWSSTNNSLTQASAKGYIPEVPWNQSCTDSVFAISRDFSGETPEQICNSSIAIDGGLSNVIGGGGGASACTQSNGSSVASCTATYSKPSWQTGTGVPADGVRDVPDVSLFASAGFFGAFYFVCRQSENPSGQPCTLNNFAGYGGTSVSSPAFAGIVSLVNQKTGSRQGNANYVLYNLASQQSQSGTACNAATGAPSAGCIFNDVTTSTIAMPCLNGTPNCNVSSASDRFGVLSGFGSTAGYDLATGLGSVNAANLVNNWTNSTFISTSTTLALAPTVITHGSPVSATVDVSSASGTPTGSVSINGLTAVGSVQSGTLASGVYAASLSNFPGGTYSVQAHYAGDGTYGSSDSNPITLTVSPEASTTTLRPLLYNAGSGSSSSVSTASYGNLFLLRADVSGYSGQGIATGNVAFIDNGAALDAGTFRLNSNGYTEDQTALLAPGSHTLTAIYAGDNSFNASQSGAVILTISRGSTTSTYSSSLTTLSAGSSFVASVRIAPQSGGYGLQPTGTVTVNAGSLVLASSVLSPADGGDIAISVSASQLSSGINPITVVYLGDSNYTGSTSVPINITVVGPTLPSTSTSIVLTAATLASTVSLAATAIVNPNSNPTVATPTGTIRFLVDGQNFGALQPLFANQAVLSNPVAGLSQGVHALTAFYSGDANYRASLSPSASFTITSGGPPSSVSITLSTDTVVQGTAVTVTSKVGPTSPTPTGTAQLLLDGNLYGLPVPLSGSTATVPLATTTLQLGGHVLQVSYSGDSSHVAGYSPVAPLNVLSPAGAFTLSPSTMVTTAAQGTSSSAVTFTATPIGGFHSAITFACTGGLPAGASCLFTPATLALTSSAAATTTLTITPSASVSQAIVEQARNHSASPALISDGATLAGLLLLLLPRRRRRWSALVLLVAVSTAGIITGCGSGVVIPTAGKGSSTAGSYAITVTATGGSTIQTATVKLSIQ